MRSSSSAGSTRSPLAALAAAASLLILLLAAPGAARAQTSTASLRGYILGPGRTPIGDAQIELRNVASGTRRGTRSNASGFYNLSAVPPSTYAVRITRLGFAPRTDTLILSVGAVVTKDYNMTEAARQLGTVQVSAARAVEDVRSTEVGTVITPAQIQNLPQLDRNFLNFATLAPGVTQRAAGISAGGASAMNSNVYIDGASYKSDVLPGGVVGQDPSIAQTLPGIGQAVGNPFPQNAVQEFRVITQNYKAEYQKASGAVITAATKSGTNEVQGDVFFEGTNQNAFARSYYDLKNPSFQKPKYHKAQFGGSIGGPIIRDKAHYFVSYEGNYQFLERQVRFNVPSGVPALPDTLLAGQGNYGTPLHSNLGFGKVDYALSDRQSLVFSANLRSDYDNRDFGGSTARTGADRIDNNVQDLLLKHTYAGQSYTNEAAVNFSRFQWKAAPTDLTDPQRIYESWGNLTRGGATSPQDFIQGRLSLRNDLTRTAASHVIKGGANVDFLDYNINKALNENPTFRYNASQPGSDTVPYSASLQVGNPDLKTHNWQLGLYVQDDWTATPRLTVYYGIRWDYESEWLNNSFVTPQWVRDSVAAFTAQFPFFNPADYVSNGRSSRPNFYKAFQPRGGFSYDVTGQNRTVVFGGGGLFYDRTIYNILLDEKYKAQRPSYNFQFRPASDTATADRSKIVWNNSYLSRAGLLQLINSGQYNRPEVFLVNNNQKPPYSTQANLGVRQALGTYELSVTGTLQNNYNQFKWMWGHLDPATGNLMWGAHGMSDILLSTDAGKSRYRALLFSLRKPMVGSARWGGDLNYTLAKSDANTYNDVEDPFALDAAYVKPTSLFMVPSRFDERHRIVMNLMGRIPGDILLSTVTTLGSGVPYSLSTGCQGPWDFTDPNGFCEKSGFTPVTQFRDDWNANPNGLGPRSQRPKGQWFGPFGKWAYRNVDLRLEKDVTTGRGQRVGIMLDVFNLFNFTNFNYDNFVYNLRWDTNQGAGPVRERIPFSTFNPRSAQLGARYTF